MPYFVDVATSNSLFFVEFQPLRRTFICRFVGQYESKSCEVTYVYGSIDPTDQLCTLNTRRINNSVIGSDTATVTIALPESEHTDSQFYFTAIGKTRIFTVAVEGTFKTGVLYTVRYNNYVYNH